ncbi:hypothetical protein THRCLA_06286 [Thraustotheca clavata]|uniref:G-patch domain-containing protein n=1 Tax=Thraustotheca clavata TaxID=74557 RepID=A0A1V9ZPV1_9STRA|nr:hypothetical protein THRCLA_06286 [Thraustotheca clavata]
MQPRKREDKRFHGAFTGGFSAGYFNTVGSKEGWQPKTFQSSRIDGGIDNQQRIEDFMDAEDDPLLGKRLELSSQYDPNSSQKDKSFQHELAQKNTAIPGFVPDDFIQPSRNSIGTSLLSNMGWKPGQGVGPKIRKRKFSRFDDAPGDADDENVVYVAPKNNVNVNEFPAPKLDNYGVGYDPYVDAPEFAFLKRRQVAAKEAVGKRQIMTFADAMKPSSGRSNMGHGLSALEENDDYDIYAVDSKDNFDRELQQATTTKRLTAPVAKSTPKFQVCSDGRPVLKGFALSTVKQKPPKVLLAAINVPPSYQPGANRPRRSTAKALYEKHQFTLPKRGVTSTLTAVQRGVILGEAVPAKQPLESKFRAGMLAAMSSRFQSANSSSSTDDANLFVMDKKGDMRKPLERSTLSWKPDRLLCKRFHVQRPDEFVDGSNKSTLVDESNARFDREIVSHLKEAEGFQEVSIKAKTEEPLSELPPVVRPPEDLFKSIFANDESTEEESDSSSSSEEEEEVQEEKPPSNDSNTTKVNHYHSTTIVPSSAPTIPQESSSSDDDSEEDSSKRKRKHKSKEKKSHKRHKSKDKKSSKKSKKHKKDRRKD